MILRFSLTSADPAALASFYREALGFVSIDSVSIDAARYGVAGYATVQRLRLGGEQIELVGFDQPGPPYPADSTSHDGWFQHLALVASDIDAVYARLCDHPGWQPVSRRGPVQLPPSSGGVRAFKFRDPEGHPLELLCFPPDKAPPHWSDAAGPPGPLRGIDHSAIVVSHVAASIDFYAGLGFAVSGQSENAGRGQDALDGADGVTVSVRALSGPASPPHLELLGYHTPAVRPGQAGRADIACSRTILSGRGPLSTDPDGHVILFETG
jgi:catechol 2,3-dioxygenase-like lactoylglutathione lyase family enzyme